MASLPKDTASAHAVDEACLVAALSDVFLSIRDREKVMHKLKEAKPQILSSDIILHGVAINKRLADGTRFLSLRSIRSLQAAIIRRRLKVCCFGKKPVVFTAPHTLELFRDGKDIHKVEDYSGTLAKRFAEIVCGSCITWTTNERDRIAAQGVPDKTNRDPNFLEDGELCQSPWFAALRSQREQLAPLWSEMGAMSACMHVDIHGMKDPLGDGADCQIGTAAMRRNLGDTRADEFCRRIEKYLRPVLQEILIKGGNGRTMDLEAGLETSRPKFEGDWGAASRRNTLTQLSTNQRLFGSCGSMCYTHAVQIELSLRLRKLLDSHRKNRESFARALVKSCMGLYE
jgi:hypothetical protein